MHYEYFYKKKFDVINNKIINQEHIKKYDLLISAFNSSYRVNFLLDNILAEKKHVFVLPEYDYLKEDVNLDETNYDIHFEDSNDESEILNKFFKNVVSNYKGKNILFDITGFLRPHIIYIVRLCKEFELENIDFLYSEPENYVKKEETSFSQDFDYIRDIKGCSGNHTYKTGNDYLILGSGYDYNMILNVAKEKKESKKVQVLGFPSLQADMFQQNILKANKAGDDIGSFNLNDEDVILSPANDPFITAKKISDYVKKIDKRKKISNLYLCPLSTKSQTLGFALFYVTEKINTATSIIFPFCKGYSKETSEGISRFWIYTIEKF